MPTRLPGAMDGEPPAACPRLASYLAIRALALVSVATGPRRRICVLCGHRVGWFLPYQGGWRRAPRLMQALQVVGSDLDNFSCPRCGGHDRERHLWLYLRESGILASLSGKRVLHFAPERVLSRKIVALAPQQYSPCDLFPASERVARVDLLDMPFEDQSFDVVIANHVLEHVADDRRAVAEIRRVLRPGGHAILQTPFSAKLATTWEDTGIDTPAARTEAFGQDDHVRLFGRDIFQRIASAGLTPLVQTHESLLAAFDPKVFGVNPGEPFFLFRRDEPAQAAAPGAQRATGTGSS